MMRLSEYSFLLEKESVRLKKLRAGNVVLIPGGAAPSSGGARVIRIPHDDRYLGTNNKSREKRGMRNQHTRESRRRENATRWIMLLLFSTY